MRKRTGAMAMFVVLTLFAATATTQDFPADCDCWVTATGTQIELPDLPAGFFGPGSDPFTSIIIAVGGEPLSNAVILANCPNAINYSLVWVDQHGNTVSPNDRHKVSQQLQPAGIEPIDTIVCRPNDTNFTGVFIGETVDVQLLELSLKSIAPITVTFGGGTSPTQYDVFVTEEGAQVSGNMTMTPTTLLPAFKAGSQTLNSLPVNFQLTFVEVLNPLNSVNLGNLSINFTGTNGTFTIGVPPVPTIGEWGAIILAALLLISGVILLKRRSRSDAAIA